MGAPLAIVSKRQEFAGSSISELARVIIAGRTEFWMSAPLGLRNSRASAYPMNPVFIRGSLATLSGVSIVAPVATVATVDCESGRGDRI